MLWATHEDQIDTLTLPFMQEGQEARQYPFGDLVRGGARLAAGSDWPVSSANPIDAIMIGVTRVAPGIEQGPIGGEHQRLSIEDAFAAYTSGTAYVNHRDHDTGYVREGYLANLIAIEPNPFAVPAEEIHLSSVVSTLSLIYIFSTPFASGNARSTSCAVRRWRPVSAENTDSTARPASRRYSPSFSAPASPAAVSGESHNLCMRCCRLKRVSPCRARMTRVALPRGTFGRVDQACHALQKDLAIAQFGELQREPRGERVASRVGKDRTIEPWALVARVCGAQLTEVGAGSGDPGSHRKYVGRNESVLLDDLFFGQTCSAEPVSYTHLDVYKRQRQS